MPRAWPQFTEEDVPVVHCWVHAKWRDTTWSQHEATYTAWGQFRREQPAAIQLQQSYDQYLDAPQGTRHQAVICAARQPHAVRLSTSVHTLLYDLATYERSGALTSRRECTHEGETSGPATH